jgi:hypothetical protein
MKVIKNKKTSEHSTTKKSKKHNMIDEEWE